MSDISKCQVRIERSLTSIENQSSSPRQAINPDDSTPFTNVRACTSGISPSGTSPGVIPDAGPSSSSSAASGSGLVFSINS